MRKTNRVIRRIAIAVELLVIASLGGTASLLPELFGGRPLLLISAALSISACEDAVASVVFGAVCGALADILSSGGIGFYAFALAVCGYIVPSLLQSKLRPTPPAALLLVFCSAAAVITASYLFGAFSYGIIDSAVLFARHGLSKIIITFICAVPLYFLDRLITGGEK